MIINKDEYYQIAWRQAACVLSFLQSIDPLCQLSSFFFIIIGKLILSTTTYVSDVEFGCVCLYFYSLLSAQWHLFLEGGLMTLIWDRVYFITSHKFVCNSIKKLIIPLETFLGRLFRGLDQKKFHVYFTCQNAVAKV